MNPIFQFSIDQLSSNQIITVFSSYLIFHHINQLNHFLCLKIFINVYSIFIDHKMIQERQNINSQN